MRHCLAAALLSILSLAAPSRALATPQVTSAVSVGGGARDRAPGGWVGVFSLALRADVLFGPATPYAARVGPFVSVRSDAFDDLVPAAGVSVQLPVSATFPLVASAGVGLDVTTASPNAVVLGRLWWGTRSYNYHAVYGIAAGLWVEARRFVGEPSRTDVIVGIDVDLEVFALPVAFLVGWSRTPR